MVFELCLAYHNKVSPWYAEEFFYYAGNIMPYVMERAAGFGYTIGRRWSND